MNKITFLLWFSVNAVLSVYGQQNVKDKLRLADSTVIQIITTTDGSTLNGRIVEIGENEIKFQTQIGTVLITISKIKEIDEISTTSQHNGEYWFPNPNSTRLFFSPTAYMLKQGEAYFQDIYVFFIGGSVGLTNNISIGGGLSIIPGASSQLIYLTPKIGVELTKKFNVAVGTLYAKVPDVNKAFGIHYGVGTYGSRDNNVTLGLGYGYSGSDIASHHPVIMIGGQTRSSKRLAFVTENWIFPHGGDALSTLGIRFFGERLSVDLGFMKIIGHGINSGFPLIPWVDFVVNFR